MSFPDNIRVLFRDRLGGLIHEYLQVARGDRVSGSHTASLPSSVNPSVKVARNTHPRR
jgi:hypothetical protein